MKRLTQIITSATRHNDITLVFLIVAIIGLMILPLPTVLVDGLIAVNLALGVLILVIATYIPGALHFSVFPSLLLFTTLFRLALNITTTRLILLKADAGAIIHTFGNFVVSGNFIVGAVIFLIITIVQFLVIAKGSERVAEVAARFTLDAMPGKQMSIDADMRAGVIDMNEARERRETVTKESQLYGALDGAMKFVKGDAIAGLIVTGVNIVGGLGIGIMQRGMEAGEALQKYGVLTIGDGLVSQIPALLISISAGVVVTRVSTEESEHLGGDIGRQFLAQPKAVLIAGILLALFGMIPGFPKPQFFSLAIVISTVGLVLLRVSAAPDEEDEESRLEAAIAAADQPKKDAPRKKMTDAEEFSITVPLLVDLSATIRDYLKAGDMNDEVIRFRRALYYDLGVPFPGINLRFRDDMEPNSYCILLQEVPLSRGWLIPGKVLVRESADNLRVMGFTFEEDKPFLPNVDSIWMDGETVPQLERAGLTYMTPAQVLTYHLSFLLKRHASEFVGIQETRYLLSKMEERYSELVKEVQRIMPLQKIAEIFQRLTQEHVSVRNLRNVLEAIVEWGQKEKDSVLLTEYIRGNLKRQISHQYTGGQNVLPVYMLHPDCEESIRSAIRQTSSGSFLALDPSVSSQFVKNVKAEVGDLKDDGRQKPVLLTSMDIRRYVRKLLEGDLYELPVLSYQELVSEVNIQPLAKIAL